MVNIRNKTWPKTFVIVTGIFLFLVVGLVVGAFWTFGEFKESLIPDEKEEEKIIDQAEQYLVTKYPNMEYEISYVLYDIGENYGNFDYAAVILNTETLGSALSPKRKLISLTTLTFGINIMFVVFIPSFSSLV